jgi:hypothetical protein
MKLPFTSEQFLRVFRDYNQSIFPLQILFYILAFAVLLLCMGQQRYTGKIVNGILAFFWLWMGIVYHLLFFASINKAAYLFGAASIIQGILFIYYGIATGRVSYKPTTGVPGFMGLFFILFALLIYPLLGIWFGHVYPASATFGVPCPTTIFTFGILLWNDTKIPKTILVIPFLWSFVGFSAAASLGMKEDISLIISSVVTVIILARKHKNSQAITG